MFVVLRIQEATQHVTLLSNVTPGRLSCSLTAWSQEEMQEHVAPLYSRRLHYTQVHCCLARKVAA